MTALRTNPNLLPHFSSTATIYSIALLILILILMIPTKLMSQNHTYSKVMIESPDKATDAKVLSILYRGTFHRLPIAGGSHYSAIVNQDQLRELKANRIKHTIVTADLSTTATPEASTEEKNNILEAARAKYGFQNFTFGSFKGFYTYDEVVRELDNMHARYPKLITAKESIGKTAQGRDIWMVKIGHDSQSIPNTFKKPNVLYSSLMHAREPQSMATLIYFMYYLLENHYMGNKPTLLGENAPKKAIKLPPNFNKVYKDIFAKMFVDVVNSYFIPVLNPDGYIYNDSLYKAEAKYQYWRKNRRKVGVKVDKNNNSYGVYGVDLNRNFPINWEQGNSNLNSETYHGPNPFSEAETNAIKVLCDSIDFTTSMDWHSYSNSILYPWGSPDYSYLKHPDNITFPNIARAMAIENKYEWGGVWQLLYSSPGDINSWLYDKYQNFSIGGEVGSVIYRISKTNPVRTLSDQYVKKHFSSKQKDWTKQLIEQLDGKTFYGYSAIARSIENTLGKQLSQTDLEYLTWFFQDFGAQDGFYPSLDRIIPLAFENKDANMQVGWAATQIKGLRELEGKKQKGHKLSETEKQEYDSRFPFVFHLSKDVVKSNLRMYKNDFYCASNNTTQEWANPGGVGIPNAFKMTEAQNGFIDKTTKLQWLMLSQGSVMKKSMSYQLLRTSYLTDINTTKAEGHSDWRLPTLEEAMTLVQPQKQNNSHAPSILFSEASLKSLLANNTIGLWTSDYESKDTVWAVNLKDGYCYPMDIKTEKAFIPLLLVRSYRNDSSTTR